VFCSRQYFSTCRNVWGKIIFETLFNKKLDFDGAEKGFELFFLCFDEVFSTCRNVLTIAFLHVEKVRISIAAGGLLRLGV
jgi:hypothetical protein